VVHTAELCEGANEVNVDKPLVPFRPPYDPETGAPTGASDAPGALGAPGALDVSIELELAPGSVSVALDGDDLVIEFGPKDPGASGSPDDHTANLAEYLEDSELQSLASELVADFEEDLRSREAWARAYVQGLDLLGMKIEERTQPWAGASGVFHPMLAESAVRFQAQAMSEMMPAGGPVGTKIIGKMTRERAEQAVRVKSELNYLITEEMSEYREEMEALTFRLPLAGSAFKKVYYDPVEDQPVAVFVPAEDFVVSYGASSLKRCPRYTHVMRKYPNEVRKLQVEGFYRDVELPEPAAEISDIQEKYNELSGAEVSASDDDRHMLLEMHVDIDLPEPFADPDGVARPYVVTIDKSSRTILSIRRNWYEDDPRKRKRMHFVHYLYLPGMGFYGIGLIHLLGGLAKASTSILRQLIDAGTLANLQAGFKARGARVKGDNTPLMPGEFRDVDVPSGALKDAIMPLPFKEPSQTLYQLLGNLVDEGRRIGSVADIQVGDISNNAPVGTTLALMERSLKVMSGVQARMHAAQGKELKLLARVVHDFMGPKYRFDVGGDFNRQKDFDVETIDVVPVSDPNASTMAQRIMQYQAALQLSQQAPQLYDLARLHRQMLEVLGIQDAGDIVKLADELKPMDPVAENMAILVQSPVKAHQYQDHEAHIAVHIAAAQDPKIQQMVGQSPFASAIQATMAAHITEHLAMQYRKEIEKKLGVPLPPEGKPLPEDVEVELSRAVALAADKLLRQSMAEAAQQQAEQAEQDPLTQIQRKELELKELELQHKMEMDKQKLVLEGLRAGGNLAVRREEIASADEREAARVGVRLATQVISTAGDETLASIKAGVELAKAAHAGLINRDDNKARSDSTTPKIGPGGEGAPE
jgi:hypothetical protein